MNIFIFLYFQPVVFQSSNIQDISCEYHPRASVKFNSLLRILTDFHLELMMLKIRVELLKKGLKLKIAG